MPNLPYLRNIFHKIGIVLLEQGFGFDWKESYVRDHIMRL